MQLPDSSYWHVAMNSLDFLRMPMFAVLAGYLYARHRVEQSALKSFLHKKAFRLLVPLVFVTTVTFILRSVTYGDETSYLAAILFHYQHFWFLQAILLIFVAVALWDSFARPNWVELCIIAFAALMLSRTFHFTEFFSINGALYLFPFFALGMILRIESTVLRSRELVTLAAALVIVVMLMRSASDAFGGNAITQFSVPAALCGVSAAYLLLVHCPKLQIFETIGAFSFTIYLWHSMAAAAARSALNSFFELNIAVEFGVLLAAGLIAPIAIHLIVQRIPVLSSLAAGLRPERRGAQLAVDPVQPTGVTVG